MICRNCGAEVDSGEAFCPECGAKMEKRAAGDTLAMRMSRRELEERVSWQRLRKRVRRVAKLVGIMLAFVLFFGGGSFAVQEVLSRYDVGKYLGKLGMEDIAESLGIEVPVTEAAGEDKAILVSSHLVDELETISDYAIFIKNGHLIEVDNIEESRAEAGKSIVDRYREIYGHGGQER